MNRELFEILRQSEYENMAPEDILAHFEEEVVLKTDSTRYSYQGISLKFGVEGGGSGNTYNFFYSATSSQPPSPSEDISMYEGETSPITVYVLDEQMNGVPLEPFENLVMVIQRGQTVIQRVEHGSLGISENSFTFTPNNELAKKGIDNTSYVWSLRDRNNGDKVIIDGKINIIKTATE